ncbi:MAG TPA: transglycosylase domain-containing protein, partial [Bellilinea sp.]|nr:transglycosylase domain-containing protein [Bellilinea sp.]
MRVKRRLGWGSWGAALLLVTLVLLGVLGLGIAYGSISSSLPEVDTLPVMLDPRSGSLLQPTRIYDRSGVHQLAVLENPGTQRRFLPLNAALPDALSPALAQAAVLVLEPDYWNDPALTWPNWSEERPLTIAERLTRDLLLPGELTDPVYRLRLQLLANRVLERYGRPQVLEWYLNSASYGHLAFGADSAARLYLGKPASQLDWYDAAQLVALLDAPALNPLDAPAAAHELQLEVLAQMAAGGLITLSDLEAARAWPAVNPPPLPAETSAAHAFIALMLEQMSQTEDRARLERGGMRILTTLDYELQQQLTCTLRSQLARLESQTSALDGVLCQAAELLPAAPLLTAAPAPVAASAVILDPLTGQVLALAGDTTLPGGEGILSRHPAGTVQTPVLALAGFARGLSPASLVWDIPADGTEALDPAEVFHGPLRLRTALTNDFQAALTTIYRQVGSAGVTATAHSLGLTDFALTEDPREILDAGPALNPLELAQAFSVFSTSGNVSGIQQPDSAEISPQLVLSVENAASDEVPSQINYLTRPVVSPQLAFLVQDILADGLSRWSNQQRNPFQLDRPAGVKIGTAVGVQSTWAVGYTRQTVTAVWLGYANPAEGLPALQVEAAAGIWSALTQFASAGQPALGWEMPTGVSLIEVCDPSGLLPTADCPNVVTEVFLDANLPVVADNLYQRFAINRETGRLATIFTPLELVEASTFLVVPPEAQEWSRQVNLPLPPVEYDNIQPVEIIPTTRFTSPAQFSFARGKVTLRGTASGDGFVSYRLQLGRGINPTAWQNINQPVMTPVAEGLLGELDTTGLNGLYIVRLMTVYEGQRVQLAYLQVTVDNTPPVVRIPYPLPGQVFAGAGQRIVTLQAEV